MSSAQPIHILFALNYSEGLSIIENYPRLHSCYPFHLLMCPSLQTRLAAAVRLQLCLRLSIAQSVTKLWGKILSPHATMGISQLHRCPVEMEILRLSEDILQSTACLFLNHVLRSMGCMKVDALMHLSVKTPKGVLSTLGPVGQAILLFTGLIIQSLMNDWTLEIQFFYPQPYYRRAC
jgi:hypothetical protein